MKLNEKQLRKIIKESITKILNEKKVTRFTPYTEKEGEENRKGIMNPSNPSYEKAKEEAAKKKKKTPFDWDSFRKNNLH